MNCDSAPLNNHPVVTNVTIDNSIKNSTPISTNHDSPIIVHQIDKQISGRDSQYLDKPSRVSFDLTKEDKLGIISHEMSIITIFGHEHFKQKSFTKFDIFHEKISTIS